MKSRGLIRGQLRYVLTAVFLLWLTSCSTPEAPSITANRLLSMAQRNDTTSLHLSIERNQTSVRYAMDTLLNECLTDQKDQTIDVESILVNRLFWLARQYERITGVSDKRRQLELYSSWSNAERVSKRNLDSVFSSLVSNYVLRRGVLSNAMLLVTLDSLNQLRFKFEEIDDLQLVSSVDFSRSQILIELGNVTDALLLLDSCSSRCRSIDYYDLAGDCELLTAQTHTRLTADFFKATEAVIRSTAAFRRIDRVDRQVHSEVFQAHIWYRLGLPTRSIESYRDVIRELKRVELPRLKGFCSYAMAEAFYDLGQLDSAAHYCRMSREVRQSLAEESGRGRSDLAYSISTLALISQAKGDTAAALEGYRQALDLFEKAGDKRETFVTINRLASFFLENGNLSDAQKLFRSVLQGTTTYEDNIAALHGLALCKYLFGELEESLELVRNCIEREKRTRQQLIVPDVKYGMLSEKVGYYYLAVRIFAEKSKQDGNPAWLDSALTYLESSRASALREQMSEVDGRATAIPATDSVIQELSRLENQLIVGSIDVDLASRRMKPLKDSLTVLQWSEAKAKGSASVVGGASGASVSELLSQLPRNQLFLNYMISELGCFVFQIRDSLITLHELPVTQHELEDSISSIVRQVSSFPWEDNSGDWQNTAKWIYSKINPIPDNSPVDSTCTVIPSGSLHMLPFGVLIDAHGQMLVSRQTISYSPSLGVFSVLNAGSNANNARRGIAFGDPKYSSDAVVRLPHTRREIAAIGSIEGLSLSKAFEGAEANKEEFRSYRFDSIDFVHLAVHGLPNPVEPMLSSLLMAPDKESDGIGIVDASEIARLTIPCGLVFLSACHSASGQIYKGEGTMSLVRPFLIAGTQTVVASLWDVDDRSAVDLVAAFYEEYGQGASPAIALTHAQRKMLEHDRPLYHHPYFWSAFATFGR